MGITVGFPLLWSRGEERRIERADENGLAPEERRTPKTLKLDPLANDVLFELDDDLD